MKKNINMSNFDRDFFRVRGYSESKKEMIYNIELTNGKEGSPYHKSYAEVLNDSDIQLMCCTGLADKNGELVYEGDIVKYINKVAEDEYEVSYYVLERENVLFYFRSLYSVKKVSLSFGFCTVSKDIVAECEVLGNIYQHKDIISQIYFKEQPERIKL